MQQYCSHLLVLTTQPSKHCQLRFPGTTQDLQKPTKLKWYSKSDPPVQVCLYPEGEIPSYAAFHNA